MPARDFENPPNPFLVAVAGWLLPGAGYLLLKEKWRGIIIGSSVLLLFLTGTLIAGVRVVEVPGYDVQSGEPIMKNGRWIMSLQPMLEVQNKLWSVPQALTGPVFFASAAASLHASKLDPDRPGRQLGTTSHSRISEIGALYLSVAGLLNLIAIIDSTWRAFADETGEGE